MIDSILTVRATAKLQREIEQELAEIEEQEDKDENSQGDDGERSS